MASGVKQGDVFWADLGEDSGERPAVVLTRSSMISRLTNVTVAPLTSNIRNLDTEVVIELADDKRCAISLDNITTIRRSSLRDRIGKLHSSEMDEVFGAIHAAFDMPF